MRMLPCNRLREALCLGSQRVSVQPQQCVTADETTRLHCAACINSPPDCPRTSKEMLLPLYTGRPLSDDAERAKQAKDLPARWSVRENKLSLAW